MKLSFKLAKDNIINNKRLYIPFILSTSGIIALTYIVNSLSHNESIAITYGGDYVTSFLSLGTTIIVFFAFIFLFYTNSFIAKKRKSEYGLYNVLGLSKIDVLKIAICELFISYLISIISGILIGILLEKIAFLFILKLLNAEVIFGFNISIVSIIGTVIYFSVVFICLSIYSAISILRNNPIKLLKEKDSGEKEPKGKWFITILGIISMGLGYYLAFMVKNAAMALAVFFPAVILVIIGTYLLFTSGSIALLQFLKRRESYYYKTNHFIVISNLMYRMKKNAVGLASICIMSVMILVMISSTTSLWFSLEKNAQLRYPRDFEIQVSNPKLNDETNVTLINDIFNEYDIKTDDYLIFDMMYLNGSFIENKITQLDNFMTNDSKEITFISLSDFNNITDSDYSLKDDQIIFINENGKYEYGSLNIKGHDYQIKEHFNDNLEIIPDGRSISNDGELIVVFNDETYNLFKQDHPYENYRYYLFNIDQNLYTTFNSTTPTALHVKLSENIEAERIYMSNIEDYSISLKGLFGAFLFLGIFLGLTFMVSIVLIIYYKQISEGEEDAYKYAIMQKVGLSDKEIKKTIHTQIIFVFFAPLIVALIHLAGSYNLVKTLLVVISQANTNMYFNTCIVCSIAFIIFYAIVYLLTSRTYYKTVAK